LTGLVLHPKGQPVQSYARGATNVESCLDQVSLQLKAVLDFMHEKKKFTMMFPRIRLLFIQLMMEVVRSSPGESKTRFVGMALDAYQEIFERYPGQKWNPDPKHNVLSFGLTMSALLNKGEPNWNMTPFPVSITDANREQFLDAVKKRRGEAVAKTIAPNCIRKG
jgi:hypothetical protein